MECIRDFIYREYLVRAILLAASTTGIGGETFQIATNAEMTVKELVENLLPTLFNAGYTNVQIRHATSRLGDIRRNFSDTSKALEMLGWKAEVEFTEGLRRTLN